MKKQSLLSVYFLVLIVLSYATCAPPTNLTRNFQKLSKLFTPLRWLKINKRVSSSFSINQRAMSSEAKMSTIEIITSRGYPVEVHSVTTDDGYILELHRIPRGKSQSADPSIQRRAVFLQHGLLNSDAAFLFQSSDKALAFVLADLGYDVWLGNSRGNTYSRKHAYLDPKEKPYWEFSFDEMGKYDIPACIQYVLSKTGRSSLSFVGHSLGGGVFFIAMTYRPELNEKIDVMIALAPATSQAYSRVPSLLLTAPIVRPLAASLNALGVTVYQPVDSLENNLRKRFCGPTLFLSNTLCQNHVFLIAGDDYRNVEPELLPVINGHHPAGSSIRTNVLFAQNYNAGQTFIPYDFGPAENLKRYGQSTPPPYDLSKVTCPVYIFWGENDKASAPKDIAWLASKLGNVKSTIRIEDPLWNHGAFLYSKDAKRLAYDRFTPLLPSPII